MTKIAKGLVVARPLAFPHFNFKAQSAIAATLMSLIGMGKSQNRLTSVNCEGQAPHDLS